MNALSLEDLARIHPGARITRVPPAAVAPTTSRYFDGRERASLLSSLEAAAAAAAAPADRGDARVLARMAAVCPKRPGTATARRWRLYRVGATVAEMLASGVTRADIAWDAERGHIVLE